MASKKNSILHRFIPLITLALMNCGGGSSTSIPDAPPPYPGFPMPANPSSTSSYPTDPQPNRSYPGDYPYSQTTAVSVPSIPISAEYTVKAKGNLWVLVQDQFGNEIEWKKLKSGDELPITQSGPLTITLSSPDKADIIDSNDKKMKIDSKSSGISIVRLP